jgi:hypothetical protein
LGGELLVVDRDRPVGADLALDRPDGALDVRHGLALGDLAYQDLTVSGERDNGRRRAPALGVRDDRRLAALEDRDHRVRGAKVNANRSCHLMLLVFPAAGSAATLSRFRSSLALPPPVSSRRLPG